MRSSGVSGDEAYLVVRYEYTPGFDELDDARRGRPGPLLVQRPRQARPDRQRQRRRATTDSSLDGADLTLRMSCGLVVQGAERGRSEGLVSSALLLG